MLALLSFAPLLTQLYVLFQIGSRRHPRRTSGKIMSNLNLTENIWDFCFNITKNQNSTQSDEATMFWVEGIGLSITSLIGILGNSMTVVVLNRISLNNVFNQVRIFICKQKLKVLSTKIFKK